MKKWKFTGLLFLITTVLLGGCSNTSNEPASITSTFFDTVITITVYNKNADSILDECIKLCKKYELLFSPTNAESEIYKLNHARGKSVQLSSETIEAIELGIQYSELTEGKFDITIAPLIDAWGFQGDNPSVPSATAITEAKSHIGYENVIIDGNTVRLVDEKAAVDLGGIAKGYIADKLKEYMKENGVTHALISLGGNVLALGGKPDGSSFNIGIQKPFSETGVTISSIKLEDASAVTSGIYQRYFEESGTIYHHILDPVTGYPCDNDLLGVTIICDSSARADALSTACFVLGLDGGMKLVNEDNSVEAVFITSDYEMHYSDGFPK
ncbi:MAG: FAD:protein FMN transferase [Bariatricus sp.]|nr:FAD:protein FMN transferase [Bariatricus sp.]